MDEVEVVGGEGERAGQGVEEAGGDGGAAGQPGDVGGEAQQVGIGIGADDRGGRGRRDRRSGGLATAGGQERGAGATQPGRPALQTGTASCMITISTSWDWGRWASLCLSTPSTKTRR